MRFLTIFFRAPLSKKLFFIRKLASKLKSITVYQFLFKNISSSAFILRPLFITHEYVSVGNKVKIWHDARIEGVEEYLGKSFEPEIILEDGVEIQQRVHITAATKLIIGTNTSILPDVLITDIDHSYNESDKPKGEQSISFKKTSIGANCSIGAGTKILAGTILGDDCVVGANSVVKGVFPSRSIIAGVPAKIIQTYNPPAGS